jgi:hypothetical protein
MQLALHVNEGSLIQLGPAEDIIDNDVGVCVLINNTPCNIARLFHVILTLGMNAINVAGPLTSQKGITLYVHFVASGPANASLSWESSSTPI